MVCSDVRRRGGGGAPVGCLAFRRHSMLPDLRTPTIEDTSRRRACSHHCPILPSMGFSSRPLPCPCPCCSCRRGKGRRWRWRRWWAMGWLRLPRVRPPQCCASPAACHPFAEGAPVSGGRERKEKRRGVGRGVRAATRETAASEIGRVAGNSGGRCGSHIIDRCGGFRPSSVSSIPSHRHRHRHRHHHHPDTFRPR